MQRRIHTANFPSPHTNASMYARLEQVLRFTAARHCPGWDVVVDARPPAACSSAMGIRSHEFNTQKDDSWCRAVEHAPDGAGLLLIDVDTMIVRPLDDIWAQDFDVAYTARPAERETGPPFNSGVLFVRVSPRTRAFFQAWNAETHRLLADPVRHEPLRRQFTGIHQSSLGVMLGAGVERTWRERLWSWPWRPWQRTNLHIRAIACAEWNCDPAFDVYDEATTRIVHVKSGLRRSIFGLFGYGYACRELTQAWKALEREALAQEAVCRTT